MTAPRIALIHATPLAIEPIGNAFQRLWPQARTTNLLEDSLAPDLAAEGRLSERMIERFLTLGRYVHGCGADAILFTCSAFGPAIEACAAAMNIPVLKPNEAMLDEALAVLGVPRGEGWIMAGCVSFGYPTGTWGVAARQPVGQLFQRQGLALGRALGEQKIHVACCSAARRSLAGGWE